MKNRDYLTVADKVRNMQGKHKLVVGDPESIRIRDKGAEMYKAFKRSGLSEEEYFWQQEREYWGIDD